MLKKSLFAAVLCAGGVWFAGGAAAFVHQNGTFENAASDETKAGGSEPRTAATPKDGRKIRRIDFENFTYDAYCGGSPPETKPSAVTVKNGKREGGDDNFPNYFETEVESYGDLDGDGGEEAAVTSLCNTGGTGQFTEGYIYTLKNGKPVLLAHFEGGDRGIGGLQSVKIKNGFLFVERSDGEADCCADKTLTSKYRWNGKTLVEIGKPVTRRLDAAAVIRFAGGKSSQMLRLAFDGRETKTFALRVNAKQTVTVTSADKNVNINPSVSINTQAIDQKPLAYGMRFTVSETGKYGFSVANLDYDARRLSFKIGIK